MNIELYIENRLCDIGSPNSLGVTLKRQFINPAELNTKDAQKSYGITLPATDTNNRIFGFGHTEETRGKFIRIYDARLVVGGVQILDGKFRLSEITRDGYKGNLGVPALTTVKDLFGESKLTEHPEWTVDFEYFAESVNRINSAAQSVPQDCIFPYVLYGLLPKSRNDDVNNPYSDRDLWDDTVAVGVEDMPPSINVLKMLEHLFESKGYSLTGSAMNDERLRKLYVSYRNKADYTQPWNWGDLGKIRLKGDWLNIDRYMDNDNPNKWEKGYYKTERDNLTAYTGDLFNSTRANIEIKEDRGAYVARSTYKDSDNAVWQTTQVRIPVSGYYQVRLYANLEIYNQGNYRNSDPVTRVQFVGGNSSGGGNVNRLQQKRYEIKLLRDFGEGDFKADESSINKRYFAENLPQQMNGYSYNGSDGLKEGQLLDVLPHYFPAMKTSTLNGKQILNETMFIDPAENPNLAVGLSWGNFDAINDYNKILDTNLVYNTGNNRENNIHGTILVGKPGFSWDMNVDRSDYARLAIASPGYMRYGIIDWYADPTVAPNMGSINSGNIKENMVFDADGLLVAAPEGVTTRVLHRYQLPDNTLTGIYIPPGSGFDDNYIYRYNTNNENTAYTEIIDLDSDGAEEIDTIEGENRSLRYISMYLMYNEGGTSFDIQNVLVIKDLGNENENDSFGWQQSTRHFIDLKNSPTNYARLGKEDGSNTNWYAEGEVHAVVWLEQGEQLKLVATSDQGKYKRNGRWSRSRYGWTNQKINFELDVIPFRTDKEWLKINTAGRSTAVMNWEDEINFRKGNIDLTGFMPAEVKTDEFIDNFCKAFNLNLSQQEGTKTFSLDIKQTNNLRNNSRIDFDLLTAAGRRTNQPLGLPSAYNIGFTIDEEEEGYKKSGNDDGGGTIRTGAPEGDIIEQKSNFSYNWMKSIRKQETAGEIELLLPVISKAEVWTGELSYPEAMVKRYTDSRQRFWYFDGLLTSGGANFYLGSLAHRDLNTALHPARVSNTLSGKSILSYKNEAGTILNNYFNLLTDADSHYTLVDCRLTPSQYDQIGNGAKVRFNGDMYYVAEVDGYDPAGKNTAKIKLIKINL